MSVDHDLAAVVDAAVARHPTFSGVVRVSRGQRIVVERVAGWSDPSASVSNTSHTRFATASGSKIFTALAALCLVERDELDIRASVADLVALPFVLDRRVTVEHLLTHTSGLLDYFDEDALSDDEALALMRVHGPSLRAPRDYLPLFPRGPVSSEPGATFRYNNGGYVLLALVLESVTGSQFPDLVRTLVFDAAGLDDAGYFPVADLPPSSAIGTFDHDGTRMQHTAVLPAVGSGDGGAYVSAVDWSRFWDALVEGRIVSVATVDRMLAHRMSTGSSTPERRYGVGVWLGMRGERTRVAYVEGCDFGVRMYSGMFFDTSLTVTVVENFGDAADDIWRSMWSVDVESDRWDRSS